MSNKPQTASQFSNWSNSLSNFHNKSSSNNPNIILSSGESGRTMMNQISRRPLIEKHPKTGLLSLTQKELKKVQECASSGAEDSVRHIKNKD